MSQLNLIKMSLSMVENSKNGSQSVIISGGDGAIYVDETRSIKAQNPKGEVVNTGSGDSTVAGMVAGLESGLSLEEAFRRSSFRYSYSI